MLRGITVALHTKTQSGVDGFNRPVYTDSIVNVDNVLVGEPSADDIINSQNLEGKKLVYTLAIPKGDTHDWENVQVDFFGESFKTFGGVVQGIEDNIPLSWNKKVKVERYG